MDADTMIYASVSGCIFAWCGIVYLYVRFTERSTKKELFREEHKRFMKNIALFELEEETVLHQLSDASTFRKLRRKNRKMERAIKKYKL